MSDSKQDSVPDTERNPVVEEVVRKEHERLRDRTGIDRQVEEETQTVRPGSDAPSRAGITPDGSGADGERG